MPRRKQKRSEIRKDYIQNRYVIIAPQRAKRPHNLERPECALPPSAGRGCAFCSPKIDREKAVCTKGGRKWRIKVLPNRFSAVALDNPEAYGAQEVVVETPHPNRQLEELPESHIAELLQVYSERTREISRNRKMQYILIFKNNGGRAGASLRHSHSQVFATSFIPPHLIDKSQRIFRYKLHHGTCVYCDVIARESGGPREVYRDQHVIAFTPYASMHNYELWILPIRHVDNITGIDVRERKSWARVLKRALTSIAKLGLPYNYYFHQVIYDTDQHLYMKLTPRGSVWAGVEIGSGVIINPVSPEDAAKYYKGEFALSGLRSSSPRRAKK